MPNTVAIQTSQYMPVGLRVQSELKHLTILVSVITFLTLCWCLHNNFEILLLSIPNQKLKQCLSSIAIRPNKFQILYFWFSHLQNVGLPTTNLMMQKDAGHPLIIELFTSYVIISNFLAVFLTLQISAAVSEVQ